MNFLSHLDLLRTFYRAIRRSDIPISYTAGFNPHAQMVFGLPLQVGVTGDAEYLDLKIDEQNQDYCIENANRDKEIYLDSLMKRLNNSLPDGLAVTAARERKSKENVMAIITHAAYEMRVGIKSGTNGSRCGVGVASDVGDVTIATAAATAATVATAVAATDVSDAAAAAAAAAAAGEALQIAVTKFLLPGPRIVAKTTKARPFKKGRNNCGDAKKIDLAPLVRNLEARSDILAMTVAAGSVNNVKPDLVLDALNAALRGDADSAPELVKLTLHRKALYVEHCGIMMKPVDKMICDLGGAP